MNYLLRWAANIGYVLAGLVFLPIALYRMIFEQRYRRGWENRFGIVPKRYGERPAIWVHAVSMGEVNAAKPMIEKICRQLPMHEVFVSTNTDTGYNRAVSLFGAEHVFFSPFDFSFCVSRAIERLRPALIILMELEVWPNLLSLANEKQVPVMVANGRITERSSRRYGLLGPITRYIFRQLTMVLTQDEIYLNRFAQMGVERHKLVTTGSLKWDGAMIGETVPSQESLAKAMGIDTNSPLLVAGSTGDDMEEETVIRCYQQLRSRWSDLQLAIIPRKPERFDHVAKLISSRGFHAVRRSEFPDGSEGPGRFVAARPVVQLGDTMGELRKFYTLSTIVFVGRTLVPMGGSDVMEVAALGKPIVVGPHVDNFADAVQKLISSGAAVMVDSPEKLASAIGQILEDKVKLRNMSQAAKDVVVSNQGATMKTVGYVCKLLGMEYDASENAIATPKMM